MESVTGPAKEILQAVWFNNLDVPTKEYIDLNENTFGIPETGEELYFAFRMLCQLPSETLSAFLQTKHVLTDTMLLNLRFTEQRDQPMF